MPDRTYWRLTDMKSAIADIRELLAGQKFEVLQTSRPTRAAFERYFEILSEASRHVPDDWKADHPKTRWRQIADLGNHVRHAYHRIDLEALWNVYSSELDALEAVVDEMIVRAKRQDPK